MEMDDINKTLSVKKLQPDCRWWMLITIMAICALAVRISIMLWLGSKGIYGGDAPGYIALGKQLHRSGDYSTPAVNWAPLQGGHPGDPTAFRTPAFPIFLSIHYWILGENDIFPRCTVVLLASVTCSLIAILGRNIFSTDCGLLAGMVWALWPPALLSGYRADSLLTETLATFFIVASVTSLSCSIQTNSSFQTGIAGFLHGLTILTRPYFIISTPIFFLWMILKPCPRGSNIRMMAVFLVGISLTLGPWLVRNWVVLGRPLLSTQAEHLYMGNNSWARGSMLGDVWTLGTKAPQMEALKTAHPGIWDSDELERSQIFREEGIRCIIYNLGHPKRFAWLEFRKATLFWGPFQDWSFGFYRYHYALALILVFVPIGLASSYRRRQGTRILLILIPI